MIWTQEKDYIMLTAMAGEGVFDSKAGTRERGNAWQAVADSLNCHEAQRSSVTQRSVRDRYNILVKRVKKNSPKKKEKVVEAILS